MKNYDVFLSHNSKDKFLVEQIAKRLVDEEKLRVFLDIWNLIPGDPWQEDLENALRQSRTVAVFLGPSGISGWHNEEMRSALNTRVNNKSQRVIPIILPNAVMPDSEEIPSFLSRLTWVDFRQGLGDEVAFRRLVAGIKGMQPGRINPNENNEIDKVKPLVSNQYSPSSIPPVLMDSIQRKTLALFIGADFPSSITGLPSRTDLAIGLANQYNIDRSLSLAEVAMRVSRGGNRFEFTDYLRRGLDITGKTPGDFYNLVVNFCVRHQISSIITTAYDNCIEEAYHAINFHYTKIVRADDISFIDDNYPILIKLYGDIQQPDTLIVTDQDHYALLRGQKYQPILETVRHILRSKTILFLGYDLTDPDFRFLFDQVAENRFSRTAYNLTQDMSYQERDVWTDRGLIVFEANLLKFLNI